MSRMIDVDKAMDRLQKKHDSIETEGLDKFGILCAMTEIASEQIIETAKPGRWILHDVYCEEQYECSECKKRFVYESHIGCDQWKFCPECGSEMNVNKNE